MIVDSSVWVAIFRENDVHHGASIAFLDLAVANQRDLNIPNLALAASQAGNRLPVHFTGLP